MVGVSKQTPSGQPIIKDIYLSFYYGAKIGIIGNNGSGKSTVLKIIADLDKQYQGEVVFNRDYSIGYLAQEPEVEVLATATSRKPWPRWLKTSSPKPAPNAKIGPPAPTTSARSSPPAPPGPAKKLPMSSNAPKTPVASRATSNQNTYCGFAHK